MAFLITIEEEEGERRFAVTDEAELVPLYDLDTDLAAVELGFEPPTGLIYYLVYEKRPFQATLHLLDPTTKLEFMGKCIEHIWPVAKANLSNDELYYAEAALCTAATGLEWHPQEGPDLQALQKFFQPLMREYRGKEAATPRGAIITAVGFLVDASKVVRQTGGHDWLTRLAVRLAARCRMAVRQVAGKRGQAGKRGLTLGIAAGLEERQWQLLEILRLGLGQYSKRDFSYPAYYDAPSGTRYHRGVWGSLERA